LKRDDDVSPLYISKNKTGKKVLITVLTECR